MAKPTVARPGDSPQARGRELARRGRELWQETGSVRLAAAELMNQARDLPSLQAFRYAAGLSQDQAAARYNEIARHQTTLGGTTINAWETWARVRGSGSPPPFASLLILAAAYGRGSLRMPDEELSPGDLVAEAYERLPPEDQLAVRAFTSRVAVPATAPGDGHGPAPAGGAPLVSSRSPWQPARRLPSPDGAVLDGYRAEGGLIGEFTLSVPTVENGNPDIR